MVAQRVEQQHLFAFSGRTGDPKLAARREVLCKRCRAITNVRRQRKIKLHIASDMHILRAESAKACHMILRLCGDTDEASEHRAGERTASRIAIR